MPPRSVPPTIIDAFRCPTCREPVNQDPAGLRCPADHLTPWRDGYLDARAVDDEATRLTNDGRAVEDDSTRITLDHFGYEWTRFSAVNPEDQVFWERYFADVHLAGLGGRLGLDAGCGKGRFSRLTAPHLAALVASDGSRATEAAAANLADQPNTCVVRADLREMPFADASFGFISCLGVLHHLADPAGGLAALGRLLAPDGLVLIYLYSRPEQPGLRSWALAVAGALRRLTVKLPSPVLRPLCWPLAAGLYGAIVLPGAAGQRLQRPRLAALPLATYRGAPLRSLWLDTFDRLSAPLEVRFTPGEVTSLFARCGLSVTALRTDPRLAGIVALGRKEGNGQHPRAQVQA